MPVSFWRRNSSGYDGAALNESLFGCDPFLGTLIADDFNSHLTAPPASGAFLFPRERGGIRRHANLCQICARALLNWQIWTIWGDERTVTYAESAAGQRPIPSLATMFSNTYGPLSPVSVPIPGLPEFAFFQW